ncbi:hypothetical protein RRG08_046189 [Elysia crispata]|uniref:Uncharacterized protein n=1 Tax=Elysia crispata TaxID=231223 RepID=A0AAE0XNB0_9GAST|nr:hypothetical protein RRG08_046189 [Elysia crispata]
MRVHETNLSSQRVQIRRGIVSGTFTEVWTIDSRPDLMYRARKKTIARGTIRQLAGVLAYVIFSCTGFTPAVSEVYHNSEWIEELKGLANIEDLLQQRREIANAQPGSLLTGSIQFPYKGL